MSESENNISFVEDNINCELSFENNELPIEEKEIFVKAAVEKIMNIYWPDPVGEFYCRICNYLEFDSDEALTKHNETDDHKLRLANEETSFCLICQVHTCNDEIMKKHEQSERHKKLQDLFGEAEVNAETFWNDEKIQQAVNVDVHPGENEEDKEVGDDAFDDNNEDNDNGLFDDSQHVNQKKHVVVLNEIYSKHGDRFKEACEQIKIKIRNFFDEKYFNTGLPDGAFIQVATRQCLKDYYPVIEGKHFCVVCNHLRFESRLHRNKHITSELHKAYAATKRFYFCKVCKINHLNEDSYKKHLQDEDHIKLTCLMHACKSEALLMAAELKKAEVNYEIMKKALYPEEGLIKDNQFCVACSQDIKQSAIDHVRSNCKHSQNFMRLVYKLKRKGFVFADGCALCQVKKKDDSYYNVKHHVRTSAHNQRYASYGKSLGFVDSNGVLGINDGNKGHFTKMNDNSNDEQDITNAITSPAVSNQTKKSKKKNKKKKKNSVASHNQIPVAKKAKLDQPSSSSASNTIETPSRKVYNQGNGARHGNQITCEVFNDSSYHGNHSNWSTYPPGYNKNGGLYGGMQHQFESGENYIRNNSNSFYNDENLYKNRRYHNF